MSRESRREKLKQMAAQTASPREAVVAREILSRMKAPPLTPGPTVSPPLVYVGRRAGVPHYQQRPPSASDGEIEVLPGVMRVPRPLAAKGKATARVKA